MKAVSTETCFRTMQPEDIAVGLRLCRASGWNQTRRDWEMLLRLSPQGCRVATKDEQVIGTVTTVNYENRFAWIGMVLVAEAQRGQGIGARLMAEAMELLHDLPAIRLDATPAGREVYRKLNFIDEYPLRRLETVVARKTLLSPGASARPMTSDDLAAVARFDREVFGADRRALLAWMLEGAPEYAWVREEQQQISGYCFGRHGFKDEHLGPVVAHEQSTARQLVAACLHSQTGRRFILDASQHEPEWHAWLEVIGFREQRPFTRMFYRNNPSPGLPPKLFGILGPEFG